MNKFRINERILTVGLNVLIGVLLFCIFLQCGVFLQQYSESRGADEEIPFNMRMLSASGQDDGSALNTALLLPSAIAVSENGSARAVVHSAAVLRDLYGDLSATLAECLSAAPVAADDAVWSRAILAPNVIYIRYHDQLPYQVLHAFAAHSTGRDYLRDAAGVGVAELCLLLNGGQAVTVVRGTGGVYTFTAPAFVTLESARAYTKMYSEVFYTCTLSDRAEGTLLITERITAREICAAGGISAALAENKTHFDTLLRALQYNPDKLNYHTETDGATVYVDSHGILWCGTDRILYTASENGGIGVEEFCTPGEADIYTYLSAASGWISKMAAMNIQYAGGDAVPYLTSVSADGVAVTLHFGLYADNLPLYYDGADTVLSMTFTGDRVTEILWRPVLVTRQLTEQKVFLESFGRQILQTDRVTLAYRAGTDRQNVGAEWTAHREREE